VQAKLAKRPQLKRKDESYLIQPDQDFKDISVIPGEDQLRAQGAKIRAMPEEGDLQNLHNYLDILFRLLLEDGTQDLRQGITQI
jgi:hypothetical protein